MKFFRIKRDLSIDFDDLHAKSLGDVAAILVINYFGFPVDKEALEGLRRRGIFLIEDWAHSFLNAKTGQLTGDTGDMAIYSFSKLVPCYTGGGIRVNCEGFHFQFQKSRAKPRTTVVMVARLFEQVVNNLNGGIIKGGFRYLESFRVKLKKSLFQGQDGSQKIQGDSYSFDKDLALSKIPFIARWVLGLNDCRENIKARRKHFLMWSEGLKEDELVKKMFKILPEDVCPWSYPVILNDRSRYEYLLRQRGVPLFTFGEKLHPYFYEVGGSMREDTLYLSNNLLSFGVHQNIHASLIHRACQIINGLGERS